MTPTLLTRQQQQQRWVVSTRRDSCKSMTTRLEALPESVPTLLTPTLIADETIPPSSTDNMMLDDGTAAAFQDQVNLLDGTVQIMLGVFVAVVAVLTVLSILANKMDEAIYQTQKDFETTLRQYYPRRWKEIEQQLPAPTSASDDQERAMKLINIMEEMMEKEPEFMKDVQKRMEF